MNSLQREKRAYIAYMSELLLKQKENPDAKLNDGTPIEIIQVEKHITDIDFLIENQEHND